MGSPEIRAAPLTGIPERGAVEGLLTRRAFLVRGAAVTGALAFPHVALGDPKTIAVYRLDPRDSKCGGGKCACNACISHDANSLFPTAEAANGNRAHTGCNCRIVQGSLHYGTYVALFGNPRHLSSYRADLRSARNQAVLKNHAPQFLAG